MINIRGSGLIKNVVTNHVFVVCESLRYYRPERQHFVKQSILVAVKGFEGGGYPMCGVHIHETVLFAVFYQREALNIVV